MALSSAQKKVKSLIKRIILYFDAITRSKKRATKKTGKVLLAISGSGPRYIHYLAHLLHRNNDVYYAINFNNVETYYYMEDSQYNLAESNIISAKPQYSCLRKEYVLLTDNVDLFERSTGWKNKIFISYDYFNQHHAGFKLPYGMHKYQYSWYDQSRLDILRKQKKRIKILFAGAADRAWYANGNINDLFNVSNRYEISEFLDEIIKENDFRLVNKPQELFRSTENDDQIDFAFLFNTKTTNDRIPIERWMEVLAMSEFFIAAPGVVMPFSHNIIEAMAVGCIPITEYGNLFQPDLNKENACIPFKGKDDFKNKVKSCLEMSDSEKSQLSRNCIRYFDKWHSDNALAERLDEISSKQNNTIYVNAEHASVQASFK